MEEIAIRAGVHRTTVSMALRNHPKLPLATRERIQKIAAEMQYVPNPLVSALMHYRAGRRRPEAQGEIAFLTNEVQETGWKRSLAYQRIFEGAHSHAATIGFQLTPIWLKRPGMNKQVLNKIFYQRNIHAAIVCPLNEHPRKLDWVDWSRVSAVAIGYSLQSPNLHRVTHDYFHAIMTAVQHTLASGYKRLGLILDGTTDDRVDHLWLGSWLALREKFQEVLPPLILQGAVAEFPLQRKQYFQEYQPDAICALPNTPMEKFSSGPEKGKLPMHVNLGCYDRNSALPGIYQNYEQIGRVAVEQVTTALFRSERGIPQQSHDTLIRGIWVPGKRKTKRKEKRDP